MQPGDRVKHRKYGLGTVKAVYPKVFGARVKFDNGHETTNSQKRLEVLTAGQGEVPPEVVTQATTVHTTRRKSSGSSQVDYELIEKAKRIVAEQHPEADEIVGKWYGTRPYVEVWKDKSAQIVFPNTWE